MTRENPPTSQATKTSCLLPGYCSLVYNHTHNIATMDSSAHPDIAIEKLRIQEVIMEGSMSSVGTRKTESMENSATETTLGASMDFDRHNTTTLRYSCQIRSNEDSGSLNWEDSFAIDDTYSAADNRGAALQTLLDTVMEPDEEEQKAVEKEESQPSKSHEQATVTGSEQMQIEQ